MQIEIIQKIRNCKQLQGKTINDILRTPRFQENLGAYWEAQKQDREAIRKSYQAMRKLGGAKGFKIPAHPIDDLLHLSVEDLSLEYFEIIGKSSKRCAAEREYIRQLCQQAYNLTIAQYVVDEYPELKDILIPKPKTN